MYVVNIANDFSPYPGGRYPEDGKFSGQEFRDNFLIPRLEANEPFIVQLDGTRGYGSSFLEEAFGGLVRCGYAAEKVLHLIKFESVRNSLKQEIIGYIKTADNKGDV